MVAGGSSCRVCTRAAPSLPPLVLSVALALANVADKVSHLVAQVGGS